MIKPNDEQDVDNTGTELLNNPAGRSEYDSNSVLLVEDQNIIINSIAPYDTKKTSIGGGEYGQKELVKDESRIEMFKDTIDKHNHAKS